MGNRAGRHLPDSMVDLYQQNRNPFMEKKFVEQMNRMEVIDELRSQAHPTWFHSLLSWSTPRLKALLVFYREDAREEKQIERPGASCLPADLMFGSIFVEINHRHN